jgi:SEC-C motif domain protein
MRSRFSAYARGDAAFVLRTWHPTTRPLGIVGGPRWIRLEILDRTGGALFDSEGTVLFDAHYLDGNKPGVMREDSRFVREGGEWFYVGPLGVGQLGFG